MQHVMRRAAVAALTVAVGGAAAAPSGAVTPAPAKNSASPINYYVNAPEVTGASNLTPESATVSGVIDTGGSPESLLPIPSSGLSWAGAVSISAGEPWLDQPSGSYVPVDGIPQNGSYSDVSVAILDNTAGTGFGSTTKYLDVSNNGADNFSDVLFAYDPVSDYVASGNAPGADTTYATDAQVPTASGLSTVSVNIGAYGPSAVKQTGNTPLLPGTKYYYWIVQQAGGTDAATSVNLAAFDQTYLNYALSQWKTSRNNPIPPTVNPYIACIPNSVIAADPTLAAYTSSTVLDPTYSSMPAGFPQPSAQPALDGPCTYYYGNTAAGAPVVETINGNPPNNVFPTSPTGEFTTPTLGSLYIAGHAKPANSGSKGSTSSSKGSKAALTLFVANRSVHSDSGTITLEDALGDVWATGSYSLDVGKHAAVTLKLTKAGKTAAKLKESAQLTYTSAWGQQSSTQSVKL